MAPDKVFIDDRFHQPETVKAFVNKLADSSAADLSDIITRYINYEPETVNAALYLSVEKGLIAYDLKELLWNQMESNFNAHYRRIKNFLWEKNNAFITYVSGYTDDELYDRIENPGDIVIDVYFAILFVAKERELISDEDFRICCQDAREGTVSGHELSSDDLARLSVSDDPEDESGSKEELEAEKEKFWKCPKCNQLVGMDLGVCWNCGEEVPSVIEHPDNAQIIKEHSEVLRDSQKSFNPFKSGFILVVFGILIALYEQKRSWHSSFANNTRFIGVGMGILVVLVGVIVIVIGIHLRSGKGNLK